MFCAHTTNFIFRVQMGTWFSHSSDVGIYVLSDCNICDRIYGSRKRCRSMEKVRYQLSEKFQMIISTKIIYFECHLSEFNSYHYILYFKNSKFEALKRWCYFPIIGHWRWNTAKNIAKWLSNCSWNSKKKRRVIRICKWT